MAKEVQIISDGTPRGTKVLVDGEPLERVTNVEFRINARDKRSYAVVTVIDASINAIAYTPEDDVSSFVKVADDGDNNASHSLESKDRQTVNQSPE